MEGCMNRFNVPELSREKGCLLVGVQPLAKVASCVIANCIRIQPVSFDTGQMVLEDNQPLDVRDKGSIDLLFQHLSLSVV